MFKYMIGDRVPAETRHGEKSNRISPLYKLSAGLTYPNVLIFVVGLLCIMFATIEIAVGAAVYNFVTAEYFFNGSNYIFGAWWSVIFVLVRTMKITAI